MRAIILAAGRGSRINQFTKNIPKALIPVYGKPLLNWQIEILSKANITDIALVRGYLANHFDHYRNLAKFENPHWAQTNMVMSLYCAREWLQKDTCIISYGDIFYPSIAITTLINSLEDISITYNTKWKELWEKRFKNPLEDAETFRMDSNNYLLEIGNRPKSLEEIQGQYMGLLKFTPKGWSTIDNWLAKQSQTTRNKIDITTLLNELIKENIKITALPVDGNWLELDTPKDVEAVSI